MASQREVRGRASSVRAEVVREPRPMWKNGVTVLIQPDDQPAMQREGWLFHSPEDIPGLADEAEQVANEFVRNLKEAVAGLSDGHVDTADTSALAAAQAALSDVEITFLSLRTIVFAAYPVKATGDVIKLQHPLAGEVAVDPSQAEAMSHAYSRGYDQPDRKSVV